MTKIAKPNITRSQTVSFTILMPWHNLRSTVIFHIWADGNSCVKEGVPFLRTAVRVCVPEGRILTWIGVNLLHILQSPPSFLRFLGYSFFSLSISLPGADVAWMIWEQTVDGIPLRTEVCLTQSAASVHGRLLLPPPLSRTGKEALPHCCTTHPSVNLHDEIIKRQARLTAERPSVSLVRNRRLSLNVLNKLRL